MEHSRRDCISHSAGPAIEGSAAAEDPRSPTRRDGTPRPQSPLTVVEPDSELVKLVHQIEDALQHYIKPRIVPAPPLPATPPDLVEKVKESKKKTRILLIRLIQRVNKLPTTRQSHGLLLLRQTKRMPNDPESLDILCGRAAIMGLGSDIVWIFEALKAEWDYRQELKDKRDGIFPRPDRNEVDKLQRWRNRLAWRKQREGLDPQDRQNIARSMDVNDDTISEEGSIDKDLTDKGFDQPGSRTYDIQHFITQMGDEAMPEILTAYSRVYGKTNLSKHCTNMVKRELLERKQSNAWNLRWDHVVVAFPDLYHEYDGKYIHDLRVAATALAAENRHYIKRMMVKIPSGAEDDADCKHLYELLTENEEMKCLAAVFVSGYKVLSRFFLLESQIQSVLLPGHLNLLNAGDSHANIADREEDADSSPVVTTLLRVIGYASHITWRVIEFEKTAGACTDPKKRHKMAVADVIHLKKLGKYYCGERDQMCSDDETPPGSPPESLPEGVNELELQVSCYDLLISHLAAILQKFEGYTLYMKAKYGALVADESRNDGGDGFENSQALRKGHE